MEELYRFSQPQWIFVGLILIRVSAFIVTGPITGSSAVPTHAKILLSLILSILLLPVVFRSSASTVSMDSALLWIIAREAFIGVVMGFFGRLLFLAVTVAGEVLSTSMGLSSAQLFNPALDFQGSALDQFELILATLFFLAINGHHIFLSGVAESYHMVPLSAAAIDFGGLSEAGVNFKSVLITGLKISAPVMVAILFVNVAMAIVGRAVPQINVLITSLPLNILVGFFILILTVPVMFLEFSGFLNNSVEQMFKVLKTF